MATIPRQLNLHLTERFCKHVKEIINQLRFLTVFTELAPAMGMAGTLIGLVAMLVAMDDPKSIGPSMSVALLTTLYGALLANAFTGPLANKLGERADEIKQHMMLVRDGVLHISNGDNPKLIIEMLASYLGENIDSPVNEKPLNN